MVSPLRVMIRGCWASAEVAAIKKMAARSADKRLTVLREGKEKVVGVISVQNPNMTGPRKEQAEPQALKGGVARGYRGHEWPLFHGCAGLGENQLATLNLEFLPVSGFDLSVRYRLTPVHAEILHVV